jgi:hypothetical protein
MSLAAAEAVWQQLAAAEWARWVIRLSNRRRCALIYNTVLSNALSLPYRVSCVFENVYRPSLASALSTLHIASTGTRRLRRQQETALLGGAVSRIVLAEAQT